MFSSLLQSPCVRASASIWGSTAPFLRWSGQRFSDYVSVIFSKALLDWFQMKITLMKYWIQPQDGVKRTGLVFKFFKCEKL